ncbi:hypothetical protein BS78_03G373800 [Paspalum vaginatum]|nr:hypothetical protein BS78_03G373800 [Paspalum vaginatum]
MMRCRRRSPLRPPAGGRSEADVADRPAPAFGHCTVVLVPKVAATSTAHVLSKTPSIMDLIAKDPVGLLTLGMMGF